MVTFNGVDVTDATSAIYATRTDVFRVSGVEIDEMGGADVLIARVYGYTDVHKGDPITLVFFEDGRTLVEAVVDRKTIDMREMYLRFRTPVGVRCLPVLQAEGESMWKAISRYDKAQYTGFAHLLHCDDYIGATSCRQDPLMRMDDFMRDDDEDCPEGY